MDWWEDGPQTIDFPNMGFSVKENMGGEMRYTLGSPLQMAILMKGYPNIANWTIKAAFFRGKSMKSMAMASIAMLNYGRVKKNDFLGQGDGITMG